MIKCSYPTGIFICYTKVAHMFFSLVYCAEKFKQNKTSELESSESVFHLVLFILFHQHHFLYQGAAVLLRLRLQCQEHLCTWPTTIILSWVSCSALLHRVPERKCRCSGSMLGTLIWHCKASACGTLWASGTMPSTKERRKSIRLY